MWRAKVCAELCLATTGVKQDSNESHIDQEIDSKHAVENPYRARIIIEYKEYQKRYDSSGKPWARSGSRARYPAVGRKGGTLSNFGLNASHRCHHLYHTSHIVAVPLHPSSSTNFVEPR
ncbi:hypothetical protein BJY52DRAFT_1417615, partial [Lactarius psammicola]